MTAEERSWYLQRYNEEIAKRNEQDKRSGSSMPRVPRPNVRR